MYNGGSFMAINIAIDGPAGAGKSSTAKLIAKKLGYIYVDTGALYRTVGLYSIRKGIDTKDAEKVIATLPDVRVELKFVDGAQHVFLNGEDVSEAIRTPEASMGIVIIGAFALFEHFLIASVRPLLDRGREENLNVGIRQNNRSDISAVHNAVVLGSYISLKRKKKIAHLGNG